MTQDPNQSENRGTGAEGTDPEGARAPGADSQSTGGQGNPVPPQPENPSAEGDRATPQDEGAPGGSGTGAHEPTGHEPTEDEPTTRLPQQAPGDSEEPTRRIPQGEPVTNPGPGGSGAGGPASGPDGSRAGESGGPAYVPPTQGQGPQGSPAAPPPSRPDPGEAPTVRQPQQPGQAPSAASAPQAPPAPQPGGEQSPPQQPGSQHTGSPQQARQEGEGIPQSGGEQSSAQQAGSQGPAGAAAGAAFAQGAGQQPDPGARGANPQTPGPQYPQSPGDSAASSGAAGQGNTPYNTGSYNAEHSHPGPNNPALNHAGPYSPQPDNPEVYAQAPQGQEQYPLAHQYLPEQHHQAEHQTQYNPWTNPPDPEPRKAKKGVGLGAVIACTLIAALLGGGVAAGAMALWGLADGDSETAAVEEDELEDTEGIDINNPEDATVVSAAAAAASPSVVTISVMSEESGGSGSGIILDTEGHVLTNTHVITLGGATADPDIYVQLADGRASEAEIVGLDPLSDLAVIRLEDTSDLTPAELGSSGDLNVGDRAIAIGAPLGLSGTVTDGIVSTLDRTIQVASSAVEDEPGIDVPEDEGQDEEGQEGEGDGEGFEFFFPDQDQPLPTEGAIYLNVIQTDAAINQGNSGGALVDAEGRVIGVNVAIASTGNMFGEGAGNIGVGFSIPIDYAQRVAEEIIANGEASHGLLGVTALPASPDPAINEENLDATEPVNPGGFTTGALVIEVSEGSPADEAGLEAGDVVTEVEGRRVDDAIQLTAMVREYAAGDTITVTVERGDEELSVDITLTGL